VRVATAAGRSVFLDRDGVLIEDVDLLVHPDQVRLLDGVAPALRRLRSTGFRLLMVTNQTVVARGLATLEQVAAVHREIDRMLIAANGPALDGSYICPHHPHATLPDYRAECDCRKPRPGLLLRAAHEYELDLSASFLVGDRVTDVAAGAAAGCRTVLVRTGRHAAPRIVTLEPLDPDLAPDHECERLAEAADYILEQSGTA
jgi:D-glycero-D-manno-heptose 1,7-bisphosphate phosphatase